MDESLLKFYSFAYVAENKPLDSHEIQAVPVEHLSFVDGEIKSNPTPMEASGIDADGQSFNDTVNVDNTVTATWLPGAGNRITPEDLRRGESVILYRYGRNEKLYWSASGLTKNLRKLETLIYCWSAHQDLDDHSVTPDNHYFLELSTHNKMITLSTSKKNGEPFKYVMQLNTDEGKLHIYDDVGNEIFLDSQETIIRLLNEDKTKIELDKKCIDIYAEEDLTAKIDRNMTINVGKKIFIEAGDEILMKVGSSTYRMVPELIEEKTPRYKASKT